MVDTNHPHVTDRLPYHTDCGGTILSGGAGDQEHSYCDTCRAYIYESELRDGDEMPRGGVPAAVNRAAWDRGDERSPDPDQETDVPAISV